MSIFSPNKQHQHNREKNKQTQQISKPTVENLPKPKPKSFYAMKKSFSIRSVVDGDGGEKAQPTVSMLMMNEQRRRENTM